MAALFNAPLKLPTHLNLPKFAWMQPYAATLCILHGEYTFDEGHALLPAHLAASDSLKRFSAEEAARINRAAEAAGEGRFPSWEYTPAGELLRNDERVAILDERELAKAAARETVLARYPGMRGFYKTLDRFEEAAHSDQVPETDFKPCVSLFPTLALFVNTLVEMGFQTWSWQSASD